jgi:nicotinamidase-related amidase
MSDSKNGYIMKGQFTPENSTLVLVDYQVGTMQLIRTSSSDVSLRNAVTLASAAKALNMPVVLTSSQEDKIQGLSRRHCRRFFPTHTRPA